MQRITDPTATAGVIAPPALTGVTGYFGPAVPGVRAATRLRYWYMTMLQEEMMAILAAGGVTPDTAGTVFTQVMTAIKNISRITFQRVPVTVTGTYTRPAGLLFAEFDLQAPGGGGGSGFGQASPNVSAGTGGSSGARVRKMLTAAQIGATAAIVIGAPGAGGAAGQNNGTDGGAVTVTPTGTGPVLTALGGLGGPYGQTATTITRGGFLAGSPVASGGDMNINGRPGTWPLLFGGASYTAISGSGGDSDYGRGGQSAQENANGNNGSGYGSAGGGAAALTVSTTGGNSAPGVVFVNEYFQLT